MIERLRKALEGKKTNLISVWVFCGALFMWMNDIGESEQQVILATVAALAASMRAGILKSGAAMFLVAVTAGMFLSGCASLARVDPGTGTSLAQDIVAGAADIGSLFGPVLGAAIPPGLGGILSIMIALGKAKDNSGASE